jgi:CRISPR system Cascade subunit CasC
MRTQVFSKLLDKVNMAKRTLKAAHLIKQELIGRKKDASEAQIISNNIIETIGLKLDNKSKTNVLLFLGTGEISALADLCEKYWDVLNSEDVDKKSKEYKELKKEALNALDGKKAADLALFGRMIAELPKQRVDAAAQVAHAISTNRLRMDFDFFTALDEELSEDEQGAGMMGTIEFNSACYYRYSNINTDQLLSNLQGDLELAKETIKCFIEATIKAIPTGKQTSMAAQNPPSFIMAIVRDDNMWSLANAFATPIKQEQGNLIGNSITSLVKYWDVLKNTYGDGEVKHVSVLSHEGDLGDLNSNKVDNMDALIDSTLKAVTF